MKTDTHQGLAAYFWENPNITELEIGHYHDDDLPRLPDSLKRLYIHNSHAFKTFPPLPNSLERMRILHCRGVSNLTADLKLSHLVYLEIDLCPGVSEFTAPRSLEHLVLKNCGGLSSVSINHWLNIRFVELVNCRNLTAFYSRRPITSLTVKNCDLLERKL